MATAGHKRRLDKLAPASGGECICKDVMPRVIYEEGYLLVGGETPPDPGPEICPRCGGKRLTIIVEVVKDWRGAPEFGEMTDDHGATPQAT